MQAQDFSLPDQQGKMHTLSEYKGKWVILYFYSKNDNAFASKQASAFRNISPVLDPMNAIVLGISQNNPQEHKIFADLHLIHFPILSDEQKSAVTAYGAWDETTNQVKPMTYLIDPESEIKKTYEVTDPSTNATQVLTDLQMLKNKLVQ